MKKLAEIEAMKTDDIFITLADSDVGEDGLRKRSKAAAAADA